MSKTVSFEVAWNNHLNCKSLFGENNENHQVARELLTDYELQLVTYQMVGRVPVKMVADISDKLSLAANEPLLGIKVINMLDVGNLSFVRQLVNNIDQYSIFETSTHYLSVYFAVLTQLADIHIAQHAERMNITITPQSSETSRHQLEGFIFGLIKIIELVTSKRPCEINIGHHQIAKDSELRKYFKLCPNYDTDAHEIVYQNKSTIGYIEEQLPEFVEALNKMVMAEFPQRHLVENCETILTSILHLGNPCREWVASILGMSVSTLKRRLKEQGTNLSDVLASVRRKRLDELCKRSDLDISKMSYWLGYKSESHFYRTVKADYNMPPYELKKLIKRGA